MPGGYVWEAKRQSIFCTSDGNYQVLSQAVAACWGVLGSHRMCIHVGMCVCGSMFAAAVDDCIFGLRLLIFFFFTSHSLPPAV